MRSMTARVTLADRILFALAYLSLVTWGVSGFFSAPISLADAAALWQLMAWSGMLAVGAATCLIAVFTDRPWFELIGLPPVLIGVGLFGVVLVYRLAAQQVAGSVGGTILVISVLSSLMSLLLLRYREVLRILRPRMSP